MKKNQFDFDNDFAEAAKMAIEPTAEQPIEQAIEQVTEQPTELRSEQTNTAVIVTAQSLVRAIASLKALLTKLRREFDIYIYSLSSVNAVVHENVTIEAPQNLSCVLDNKIEECCDKIAETISTSSDAAKRRLDASTGAACNRFEIASGKASYSIANILSEYSQRLDQQLADGTNRIAAMLSESSQRLEQQLADGAKLIASRERRTSLPPLAFNCLLLLLVFLATFFGGIVALNFYLWHNPQIWQLVAATTGLTAIALTITLFIHHKSKPLTNLDV